MNKQTVLQHAEQEQQIMAVGSARRWPFRALGVAPAISQPVFYKNWWFVPIEQDRSLIPTRTLERVQAIYAAGIRPKAFIIAHEAPPQLAAPANRSRAPQWQTWAKQAARHSISGIRFVGNVVSTVAPMALMVLLALGLLLPLLIDPCLIVVTEDDVWIQIDAWMVQA